MKHLFSLKTSGALASFLFLWLLAGPAARAQTPVWQTAQAFAQPAGSTSQVTSTATDANGNTYLAGFFVGTIAFGSTTLTSAGGSDVFVAKWNPVTNSFSWAQRGGGTADERATALALSGTSVFVTGYFTSATAGFGGTTLTNTSVSGAGGDFDVFVGKITDAGNTSSFGWATMAGSVGVDRAYALAAVGNAVYIGGSFNSTAAFGNLSITSSGGTEAFVAKLLDMGTTCTFVWVKQARSLGTSINVYALAVSGTSVYAAGAFLGASATLGAVALANSSSNFDGFVAKLTDMGSSADFVWGQSVGGTNTDDIQGLAVRGGALYISGNFLGTASFGNIALTSVGLYDVFVAKLTDAGGTGSVVWALRAGGPDNDYAPALGVSGTNLCVAGAFRGTADFGSTALTSTGDYDVFAAKIIDAGGAGNFAWAQRAGGAGVDAAATVVLNHNSMYVAGSLTPPAVFGSFTLTGQANARIGFLASLTDPTLTATAAARPREPAALFPNPARHTATLRWPIGTAPAPLALTDALGREVRRYPAPTGAEAVLDVSGLPAGLYLLHGTGPTQRLVVE